MLIIKKLGIILAALVVLVMLAALFVSGDVSYEQSITIDAPADKVWAHVSTLEAIDSWSPWTEKDPNMKKEFTGKDGTIGAESCWESDNEEVGAGCQKIVQIDPGRQVITDLKFYTPYESEAQAFLNLEAKGDQTEASWKFASTMPYPFRIMKIFMSMESMLKDDFAKGLNKLKDFSENG